MFFLNVAIHGGVFKIKPQIHIGNMKKTDDMLSQMV